MRQSTDISFLITGAGEHVATDQALLAKGASANGTGDPVNLAVTQNGFVFISLAHNVAMFELCPSKSTAASRIGNIARTERNARGVRPNVAPRQLMADVQVRILHFRKVSN